MASSKDYLDFIMEQLRDVEDVSYRAMMGEYIIYYHEKVIGGIYDNRFLVKDVPAARALMDEVREEIPYPGAKALLLVENVDDRSYLQELFDAILAQLKKK